MNITVRQLRYFVEIARSRSFSRAAQLLRVAQPALSQSIAALEDAFGSSLFERHARGVDLSSAGQRLYGPAVDLLERLDGLEDHVVGRQARPTGRVRLAISGSLSGVVIAPLLRTVATDYPGIELTVSEGMSSETRAQVESGLAHLGLLPSPSELQGIESQPILEERFMLFGRYDRMRRAPKQLDFAEVVRRPLAAPDGAHDLRKVIERAAHSIDCKLDVRYELNSPQMLIAVVKEGLAEAILPPSACIEAVAAKAIAGRPIVSPELGRVQAIVWPRERPLSSAAAAIRGALVVIVTQLVEQGLLHGRLIPQGRDAP